MEQKKKLGCCGYDEMGSKPPTTQKYDPFKPRIPIAPVMMNREIPRVIPVRPQMGRAFLFQGPSNFR